ncbi:hypothetical protein [Azobacteroides phage ProJPt-Bp1]|uniref:Uncharacterized protein n=1 Tax=Azobacteroides phage ProJPt-Bp1 TaxID=1920526 RepID=A0A1V1FL05_9CAUD|nr:hypothetical protein KNT10_gp02 [Azobacteroides phage ProJPt-Bp1]BAX03407.1 hypothetical protein [Azobacteroides phage ProJPt-Bp1]
MGIWNSQVLGDQGRKSFPPGLRENIWLDNIEYCTAANGSGYIKLTFAAGEKGPYNKSCIFEPREPAGFRERQKNGLSKYMEQRRNNINTRISELLNIFYKSPKTIDADTFADYASKVCEYIKESDDYKCKIKLRGVFVVNTNAKTGDQFVVLRESSLENNLEKMVDAPLIRVFDTDVVEYAKQIKTEGEFTESDDLPF